MRTPDEPTDDRFQPLGHPVPKPAAPAPDPKRIAPGIVEDKDGHWRTDLPLPKE